MPKPIEWILFSSKCEAGKGIEGERKTERERERD